EDARFPDAAEEPNREGDERRGPIGTELRTPLEGSEVARSGSTSLTESLAVDSEWDEIDVMATQPVRPDAFLTAMKSQSPTEEIALQSTSTAGASPETLAIPEWPPPATGCDPVRPTNPDLCVWCPGRVSDGYCAKCGFLQPTGRDHVEVRTDLA